MPSYDVITHKATLQVGLHVIILDVELKENAPASKKVEKGKVLEKRTARKIGQKKIFNAIRRRSMM